MKRIAYLALPLLLCALLWGAKWRADHPAPTKSDLQARALLLEASEIEVGHLHRNWKKQKKYDVTLSGKDIEDLAQCLYISPQPIQWNRMKTRGNGAVQIACFIYRANEKNGEALGINFQIPVDEFDGREGRVHIMYLGRNVEYNLRRITTRRWTYLLLNHERLGPEIRARLKS